jgi:DNA cross-link repair 1A protein
MKQKKKAPKTPSQASTLLDFFQAKTATPSSAQKGKQRDESTKRKPLASIQREVIVIDSDSDSDAVEVVAYSSGSAKRRKVTASNPQASTSSVKLEDTGASSSILTSNPLAFGDPFLFDKGSERAVGTSNTVEQGPSRPAHFPLQKKEDCSNGHRGGSNPLDDTLGAGPSSRPLPAPLQQDTDCSNVGLSIPSEESLLKPDTSGDSSGVDVDMTLDFWDEGDDEYADPTLVPPDDAHTPDQCEETQKDYDLKPNDAFSMIMSGFKEDHAWKEAAVAEDRSFRANKSNGNRRKAPFYKVLQGMPIAVDAFRYGAIPGVTAYFLTHAHSDHYTNLSSSWSHGPIYCSEGTANLIIHMLSVDKKWVKPFHMDIPTTIPDSGGVQVTLIEANHCPGSCLFYFEGRQTVNAGDGTFKSSYIGSNRTFRYLHCGDFRASPRHVLHPAVKGKWIDHVYLDTTYLDPKVRTPRLTLS